MVRKIYVGENYSRKVTTPLISTDRNSYKIIWSTEAASGIFKIVASRADGSTVFDYGDIDAEGMATYVISPDMYSIEGQLKLFLAIVDENSITTCREINFIVKYIDAEEQFVKENINPLNSLTQKLVQVETDALNGLEKVSFYGETAVYVLQDGLDITIEDGVVTGFLESDFTQYEAIAFPEGIAEISLPKAVNITAKKLYTPRSLKKINLNSFGGNDYESNVKIDEVVFIEGLEYIKNGCFSYAQVKKITLPETLKEIGSNFFANSKELKELVVPESVEKTLVNIGANSELEKVVIKNNNMIMSKTMGNENTVIWGHVGSTAEQKAHESGQQFKSIGYNKRMVTSTSFVAHITPNTFVSFSQNVSQVTASLSGVNNGCFDEYMFSFETPDDLTSFSLTVMSGEGVNIKWIKEPILKPGYIYEVSVVNGVGVIAGTPKEVA